MAARAKKTSAKPKFQLGANATPPGQRKMSIPKRLADIDANDAGLCGQMKVPPPPEDITGHFDWGCDLWLSFDVETHELAPLSKREWELGEFGHMRRATNDSSVRSLRVVQFGWTFGDMQATQPPITKMLLVKPSDYHICPAVAKIHKITTEKASDQGVALHHALCELLRDVTAVVGKGGRLCGHNLEFDAAIVGREIVRAGLGRFVQASWAMAVEGGLCTMNPYLTKWCCDEHLRTTKFYGNYDTQQMSPVSLGNLVRILDPTEQTSCGPAHDAGADSRMVWLVLRELHRLVRGHARNASAT